MVCGSASDCTSLDDDGSPCALILLPEVSPRHSGISHQSRIDILRLSDRTGRRYLRRAGLDWLRNTGIAEAIRDSYDGSNCGHRLGSLALACGCMGKRHCPWKADAGQLHARPFPILSDVPDSHGLGIRLHRKPVCSNPNARELDSWRADHKRSGDRRLASYGIRLGVVRGSLGCHWIGRSQ